MNKINTLVHTDQFRSALRNFILVYVSLLLTIIYLMAGA